MKNKSYVAVAMLTLAVFSIIACTSSTTNPPATPPTAQDKIARGKYLVTTMGCGDCHTPKTFGPQGMAPDTTLALSGHPAGEKIAVTDTAILKSFVLFNFNNTACVGPWGISYASNITSDGTGIGKWTEQQFFTAIRKGKSKGIETNRPLLPPMPWPNFAQLQDEDLSAIFAYLKSTKPVNNLVPQPTPPNQLAVK